MTNPDNDNFWATVGMQDGDLFALRRLLLGSAPVGPGVRAMLAEMIDPNGQTTHALVARRRKPGNPTGDLDMVLDQLSIGLRVLKPRKKLNLSKKAAVADVYGKMRLSSATVYRATAVAEELVRSYGDWVRMRDEEIPMPLCDRAD